MSDTLCSSDLIELHHDRDICVLRLCSPPVNALARPLRISLFSTLQDLVSDSVTKAIIITGSDSCFIAGADIKELDSAPTDPQLPEITEYIESSPKPIIAALNGLALGGGLEIALSCHYRLAHPSSKLGFPEVNLGILPGSGGTVRISRLSDFPTATTLVSTGKPITAIEAHKQGIIDELSENLESDALLRTEQLLLNPPTPTLSRPIRLQASESDWQELFSRHTSSLSPAPLEALESVKSGIELPIPSALTQERERFLRLKQTFQSRALRHLFFAERSACNEIPTTSSISVDTIGIIGAGMMGSGIAVSGLLRGFKILLAEPDSSQVSKSKSSISKLLDQATERNIISSATRRSLDDNIEYSSSLSCFSDCNFIIEAVAEDESIKRDVLKDLESHISPEAIICSNTSYLDLESLSTTLRHPSRFIGLHFFAPAHINKLVELIKTSTSSSTSLSTAKVITKRLGKLSVLSGSSSGFIGNRLLSSYRRECDFLLEQGAMPIDIDSAMRDFGYRLGNYEVSDMSGLDIAWTQRQRSSESHSRLPDILCERNWFGRKSKRGWYDYSQDSSGVEYPELKDIIHSESKSLGITRKKFSSKEIMQRILLAMKTESDNLLSKGTAFKSSDIDIVSVTGLGFPRPLGGPLFYLGETQ